MEGQARARFNFQAQTSLEMTLNKGLYQTLYVILFIKNGIFLKVVPRSGDISFAAALFVEKIQEIEIESSHLILS